MAVFLRKLKYFNRILFLIINLLYQFNAVILNKIHLIIKYEELNKDIRRIIIIYFLKMANTDFGDKDLNRLTKIKFNGR
jgi:hypothetical protein